MSGQSPLKVPRGLRYLIFRFGEEFKKSLHSRQQLFWICDVYVDFLNLPASWIVLIYFHRIVFPDTREEK